MTETITDRLRATEDPLSHEAADMLDFFFGQMQSHSLKMDGNHSYRFHSGWPMTHCKGPTYEIAVKAAIKEVKRAHAELVRDVEKEEATAPDEK